ncbi:MAG: putative manganese transporter [Candidatus Limimorpha sp.]
MREFLELFTDVLKNSILITGLVTIMMLMIEYVNIHSHGRLFGKLRGNRFGQVLWGAGLGLIPGCLGGFATVSLFSHKLLSFGALVAMMIASSGDEAFVMLATIPKQALVLGALLFVIAVVVGVLVDRFPGKSRKTRRMGCDESYQLHDADDESHSTHEKPSFKNLRKPGVERIVLLAGVILFITTLSLGALEHDHGHESATHSTEPTVEIESTNDVVNQEFHTQGSTLNIFDEYWLNLIFAIISLFVVYFIATASQHVVKEHLWNHIISKHFLLIFVWTFGALLVIQIGLHYFDIESRISSNIPWMILLAVLIGIIPESGPHLIFVMLFASGVIPFSVLLASSVSQDGHSSIPLLAESKMGFLKAKAINTVVAAFCGYLCYFIGF